MSTDVTHADLTPPPAPLHQCINAGCGCNDLVSAGTCSEWCMGNTTELADLEKGKATLTACGCGHELCARNGSAVGTPDRGMA